jgi:hypothetical protein
MVWPYQRTLDLAGKAARDKHSSLLRKFVNYRQESFITLVENSFSTLQSNVDGSFPDSTRKKEKKSFFFIFTLQRNA